MKIGIFGGSFNPIHNAHITLADTICEKAGLDEVWFLVSPHNPLKQSSSLLNECDRLEMVRVALCNHPRLIVSDYEFHLQRPSYTWNTLQHLSSDFPQHEFVLLIGADNWCLFSKWAHYEDILSNYAIVIYPRPGYVIDIKTLPCNVSFVSMPEMDINSTSIRNMLCEGKDVSSFVPEDVLEIIKSKKYYNS